MTNMALKLYLYSLTFTSLSSFGLGFFVLYKNPKNLVNQTWFLSCCAVGTWSTFFCLSMFTENTEKALSYIKILTVAASFIPVFLTHFCIVITNPTKKYTPLLIVGYANCLLLTCSA